MSNQDTVRTERHCIEGPAGDLEGEIDLPRDAPRGVALVCHPHPVHGGTMDNKVAYMLARAFNDAGLAALRFNFRGVGRSAGQYDHGRGELDDARCAADHLQQQLPDLPLLWSGFSFGSIVALKLALDNPPERLVSIAPPLFYFDEAPTPVPPCPWLVVHGLADEVVDAEDTRQRLADVRPAPTQHWLPEMGHFFHGKLSVLRKLVAEDTRQAWDAAH